MQITTRATVLAVALLASAPLLAAGSDTTSVGTDVSTPETTTTTGQGDCWLPAPPSTDLSTDLAGFVPKPDSKSCVRPLSLWNDEPEDGASLKRSYSVTAMPAGTGTTWPRQSSFLEHPHGAHGLSGF